MNITYSGNGCFVLKAGKSATMAFEPGDDFGDKVTCSTFSSGKVNEKVKTDRSLYLPGEYEIGGILVRSLYTDDRTNVVFKVTFEDIALAHFGNIGDLPIGNFFEELGENVSVAIIHASENFDSKKIKTLLDKVGPRYVLVTGDEIHTKGLIDNLAAKKAEDNTINITKASLNEDRMDVILF
ncbi:MAG TPA: hypothetical protein VIT68_04065 [Candidatus Gracilibacteria bacterium]